MAEDSFQLPDEGNSGKIVRFIRLMIGGFERLHEVAIPATPDGALYDSRGGFQTLVAVEDTAITTAAAAFAAQSCVVAMVVADFSNTDYVLIGSASVQAVQLGAGDRISIPIDNTNKIYRKSASGTQRVAILALS
jgi:hypothetical protein